MPSFIVRLMLETLYQTYGLKYLPKTRLNRSVRVSDSLPTKIR